MGATELPHPYASEDRVPAGLLCITADAPVRQKSRILIFDRQSIHAGIGD
jgi:hypothetical protein